MTPHVNMAMLGMLDSPSLLSTRKRRLLSVGLCRLYGIILPPEAVAILDRLESVADGLCPESELDHLNGSAEQLDAACQDPLAGETPLQRAVFATSLAASRRGGEIGVMCFIEPEAGLLQADVIRCVCPNPFRPVALDPSWLTASVVALAGGIYEEKVFDQMPILADALQDAGCENGGMLNHCRSAGPHVRGCWVVDLVRGNE